MSRLAVVFGGALACSAMALDLRAEDPEPAVSPTATPESPAATPKSPVATPAAHPWCDASLEALSDSVCFAPGKADPTGERTLVVFLHGLTDVDSDWQYAVQKGLRGYAAKHHFDLITPRGRRRIGPGKNANQWAWPASAEAQKTVEDDVLSEWAEAKKVLEARSLPYDRVYVMGFSNGAYYASSVALRGKLADVFPVDGFAVFAGGSAPPGTGRVAPPRSKRTPIFVGVATKDGTTRDKARALVKTLKTLGWPHEALERPVGHSVADAHVAAALTFLRRASSSPPPAAPSKPKISKLKRSKSKR